MADPFPYGSNYFPPSDATPNALSALSPGGSAPYGPNLRQNYGAPANALGYVSPNAAAGYMSPEAVAAGGKKPVPQMDGNLSTEKTITITADGKHYVIPTIINGQSYTPDAAVDEFMAGRNLPLGSFNSLDEANAFAEDRSRRLDAAFGGGGTLKKGYSNPAAGGLIGQTPANALALGVRPL